MGSESFKDILLEHFDILINFNGLRVFFFNPDINRNVFYDFIE